MQKGQVYRVYPTKEQEHIIAQQIGSCRFVYNKLYEIRQVMYDKFKINMSEYELSRQLPILKEIYPWLSETYARSLQLANKNLHKAYKNFFDGRAGYPKRKSKKDNNQSYQVEGYQINLATSQIYIHNVGWVKIKLHRALLDFDLVEKDMIIRQTKNNEFLKTLTVSRSSTGKYHVSILTNDQKEAPAKQYYDSSTTIGIDIGIKVFAALSNGEVIDSPRYLKSSLHRLTRLHRNVDRKVLGSNNRKKAIKKLAKCHEKVANQRNDFQHKLSIKLIGENQAIALETLNVKGMLKNHCLAQAVSDAAWSSFVNKLVYKADWYGKTILRIGRFEPSSKKCNICGYVKNDLTLRVREWRCPDCNSIHDRDINAAINIKNFALSPVECGVVLGDS